jgi:predicted transcriptional regulator
MDDEHEYWDEASELNQKQTEIQKLFSLMEAKAKSAMNYLMLEGFVKASETSGKYEYTPEGLVLAQRQYKKLKDEGLL